MDKEKTLVAPQNIYDKGIIQTAERVQEGESKTCSEINLIKNVYIKHNNDKKIYTIPTTASIHSKLLRNLIIENISEDTCGKIETNPLVITAVKLEAWNYIINYMMYYNNKLEKCAPESPLKKIHISVILGDEYTLFDNIYNEHDTLKEKILKIQNIREASVYFDFKYMFQKLSAIMASLISDADINELQEIKNN